MCPMTAYQSVAICSPTIGGRLELPPTSVRRSIVNCYSKYSQKKRTNKLPYGTCELVVHSTEIVETIYGSIQELARSGWTESLGCARACRARALALRLAGR